LAQKIVEQAQKIYGEDYVVAGVATGAIGIGMLVADILNAPFIYVRPEPKSYGRQNQIEGQLYPDQKVLVIEDLISSGKSSLNAVKALKKGGIEVLGMLGLFDYGFDLALDNFKAENVTLHTLSDYDHLIIEAEKSNYILAHQISVLKSWRRSPSEWQPA
jgi:orotate phosphoribosyltransferase